MQPHVFSLYPPPPSPSLEMMDFEYDPNFLGPICYEASTAVFTMCPLPSHLVVGEYHGRSCA